MAENYGLSNRAKAKELLTMFQLEDAAGRKVASYSGDEAEAGPCLCPFAGAGAIDSGRASFSHGSSWPQAGLNPFRDLAGSTTVFFSSHILADVERVCQRVIVIKKEKTLSPVWMSSQAGQTTI